MSALADFAHKFGSEARELKIGQSFFRDADSSVFHTIRYDFVPASIDPNKTSAVDFGENSKVTITMPNLEGSGTTESVYQGQRKPHQKECVLIINNETGDMILERLSQSMIVKKARLRQEDLTGKSLALNKVNNAMPVTNGKLDKKSGAARPQSVTPPNKQPKLSPPLPKTHVNGKSTPSPPSMPIFNKGTLLHNSDDSRSKLPSAPSKSKSSPPKPTPPPVMKVNDLSESSSDSSDSDDESQSSDSETEKGLTGLTNGHRSMPTLSMPSSFLALSAFPATSATASNNSSPVTDQKKKNLTLSEDSDSDSDGETRLPKKSAKTESPHAKSEANKSSRSFADSMPKLNGTSPPVNNSARGPVLAVAPAFPPMPKITELSQDLQLSESGSDSDD